MEFILEEIEVKAESGTHDCVDVNPTSSDWKLNANVYCKVTLVRMNMLAVKKEFQSASEDESNLGTDMFIEPTECTSAHHVDLNLSDMFLLEKAIKVDPVDIEMSCDDPLSLSDLNNDAVHTVSKSVHCETSKKVKPYKCERGGCGKSYLRLQSLKNHKQTHTTEKRFECDACGKKFHTSYALTAHGLVHIEGKKRIKHKCKTCGNSYSHKSALRRHMITHTGQKPFNCDLCEKSFTDSSSLSRHRLTHTGEKPFKCETCGMGFSQSGSLTKHMMLHTGKKPFKCDLCERSFRDRPRLIEHKASHTGDRLFKCESCGNSYMSSEALNKHKVIHTQTLNCGVCKMNFTDLYNLNVHKRSHDMRVKLYKCDLCGKAFRSQSYLSSHNDLHKGVISYKCEKCGKDLTTPDSLRRHLNNHAQN